MRDPRLVLLLLLLLVAALVLTGPSAAGRARRVADVAALVAGTDHAHAEGRPVVGEGPGVLVVDLVDGSGEAELAAVEALVGADLDWLSPHTVDEALAIGVVDDLAAATAALAGLPVVEAAEPDVEVVALGWPDDPMYPQQWNLRAIGAEAGWWHTPMGAGVVVAVIDTGVATVEDIDGARLLEGATFVPGTQTAADDVGHGTHVAGTVAQATHNGLGVAGVAPAARILPVKVLSAHGTGTAAQVAAGIDWAVDQGAQVINLSLGGGTYSRVLHLAVRKARERGVLVVAAAGNDGTGRVSWPGALPEAIGVAAVGPDGSRAPYSNHGRGVDLSAPGGDKRVPGGGILQSTLDGRGGQAYRELQGTSMATPHVAGAAAVLLSTGFLGPDDVERLLFAGADGDAWSPEHGWGRLDLAGALALTGVQPGPRPWVVGGVIGLLVAGLSGRGGGFRLLAGLLGALLAGGLPGVAAVPGVLPGMLGRGVLFWPVVVFGPVWGQVPPWFGGLLPLAVAFFLGPVRGARPFVIGLGAAVTTGLLLALVDGAWTPWWMPGFVGRAWLGTQALLALFSAMAVAGLARLDADEV